ncbi:ABC transporter ATP-binding protein [Paenibacillus senegalensis]|uniref:ABC transporter ATP-binding protein n=1 Tax=Paenibacillus senegalensis TaxID=1465766 RepID=UPI001F2EF2E5|nr:ABC transporter ATP-binding protein [Paenibacillus senegalensis]
MKQLAVKDLAFAYGQGDTIRGIEASWRQGQFVSIVGPNGAGKTTLIKCLASIYKTRQGTVELEGQPLAAIPPRERAKKIGYVPQNTAMSFPLTVMETVLLGRKPYVRWGISRKDLDLVQHILEDLQLSDMADRYVDELSGGERQKVFIARALAQQPDVLLLDEPIAALDIRHQLSVLEKVKELVRRDQKLAIMILHDLELASRYSDHIVLLRKGEIFAAGAPADVLTESHLQEVYGVKTRVEPGEYGLKITAIQPVEGA